MNKILSILMLACISLTSLSAQDKKAQETTDPLHELDIMMEQLFDSWNSGMDSAQVKRLEEDPFGAMGFSLDSSFFQSFMNEEALGEMFRGFFPEEMDSAEIQMLFDESLGWLESMDENQMRSLLDGIDFNTIDQMFEGFDINQLDQMFKGFDFNIPENYLDSLEHSIREQQPENKNIKRI